jgi:hypothetical protein
MAPGDRLPQNGSGGNRQPVQAAFPMPASTPASSPQGPISISTLTRLSKSGSLCGSIHWRHRGRDTEMEKASSEPQGAGLGRPPSWICLSPADEVEEVERGAIAALINEAWPPGLPSSAFPRWMTPWGTLRNPESGTQPQSRGTKKAKVPQSVTQQTTEQSFPTLNMHNLASVT